MSDSDSEYEDMYEDKRGNEDDAKEEEKGKKYVKLVFTLVLSYLLLILPDL